MGTQNELVEHIDVSPVIVMVIMFSRKYSARRGGHNYDPNCDHSTGLELVIAASAS
jgi:heme/copper-type cytochrome/quinol oxidase subunit 2